MVSCVRPVLQYSQFSASSGRTEIAGARRVLGADLSSDPPKSICINLLE